MKNIDKGKDIDKDKLKYESQFWASYGKYLDGYRIVYFYNNGDYVVGEYCKTIEGFMTSFAKNNPVLNDTDVPKFISVDDLLNRYLNDMSDIKSIAIYKTDGSLVGKKDRTKSNAK